MEQRIESTADPQVREKTPFLKRLLAPHFIIGLLIALVGCFALYWLEVRVYGDAIDFGLWRYSPAALALVLRQLFVKPREEGEEELSKTTHVTMALVLLGLLAIFLLLIYSKNRYNPGLFQIIALPLIPLLLGRLQRGKTPEQKHSINMYAAGVLMVGTLIGAILFAVLLRPVTAEQATAAVEAQGYQNVQLTGGLQTGLAYRLCGVPLSQDELDAIEDMGTYWFLAERNGQRLDVFYGLLQNEVLTSRTAQ